MSAAACPSAPCAPGATLLGVLGRDGRIAPVRTGLVVTDAFAREAARHGPPEARMRFASPCVEGACAHWSDARCAFADGMLAHLAAIGRTPPQDAPLPPCRLRAACRWHRQRGAAACRACPMVVTEDGGLSGDA